MRIGGSCTALAGLLALAGCAEVVPQQEEGPPLEAAQDPQATVMPAATRRPGEAVLPAAGLPPFAQRTGLEPGGRSWIQQLEPAETELCSFTERPPGARPRGLVVTAWSGNMDLLTEGYVLGHDQADGLVEAMWMKNKPAIAARAGLPDLWIEPVGDLTNTILRIGPDELTCVAWQG